MRKGKSKVSSYWSDNRVRSANHSGFAELCTHFADRGVDSLPENRISICIFKRSVLSNRPFPGQSNGIIVESTADFQTGHLRVLNQQGLCRPLPFRSVGRQEDCVCALTLSCRSLSVNAA